MKKFFFNSFMYLIGIIVLLINKFRYLYGYKNPRSFSTTEIEKSVEYNYTVTKNFSDHLDSYGKTTFKGKTILEMGVGPDIGNALILLEKQAEKYIGFDITELYTSASLDHYQHLTNHPKTNTNNKLMSNYEDFVSGKSEKINTIIDPSYNIIKSLNNIDFDVVCSQASFEHFDDIEKTLSELGVVSKSGTILISEVDFQTHTRLIKKIDPLNIYRYSPKLYSLFHFQGIPNRSRICDYEIALKNSGWKNIKVFPKIILNNSSLSYVKYFLNKKFRIDEMNVLSAVICATKA